MVIKFVAVATKSPSVAIGKFSSNWSVESLNRMFALSPLPLLMVTPPEIKEIPVPVSPLLISIRLSLIARLVVLIVVWVPVTFKSVTVTVSLKVLLPAMVWSDVSLTVVESNVDISESLLVICVCRV